MPGTDQALGGADGPTNPRWLLTGAESIVLTETPVPTECGPYEAIVQPKFTGLCGSDMHVYLHAKNRGRSMARPHVLGHETAAVVVKVGTAVTGLNVGDRVALEPGEACLRCAFCKSGHYAHCRDMKFASAMARDGTLQGYYTLSADLCYKLPEGISLEEGVLMEPLSVAVQAVQYVAQMRPLSNVVVFGAGPVGLLTMAVARALGARRVIGIDANASRADFAKGFAATDTHVAAPVEPQEERTSYSERHAALISDKFGLDEFGRDGIDIVFECSGIETCVQTGLLLLKKRGTLVQVGNSAGYASVPLLAITDRELSLRGSFRYGSGCFTTAIDLVHRGLIDVKPLITHKFAWDVAPLAFRTTRAQKGPDGRPAIKVLIAGAA